MFKSATIKLMFWYVVFTMGLSLVFSGVLYQFSTHELREGLHNQYTALVDDDRDSDSRDSETSIELTSRSQHLVQNLIYFNTLVFFGAFISSHILARRTLRPIEIAHQAQVRFSAEASHELRTPLAAMKADTESVLMQRKDYPAVLRRTLERNLLDIQKLENLTNHLLELSRYKSQAAVEKQSVELDPIINDVIALFERQTKEKKITVNTTVEPLAVAADAQSLRQLITIVLDNAIKYSESKTRISIQLTTKNKQAVLTIIDQGIGIRSEDLPHIFKHFYRSNHRSKSQEEITGYGLGLPLAKDIVELYGGNIDIKSKEAKGTTVTIILPLV